MADLIDLTSYKKVVGIASTNVDFDFALNTYITSVSQLVKTYCNNSFVDYFSTDKIETFSIDWAQNFVQLTESPVTTISDVKERTAITENYTALTSTEYYLDNSTDTVYRVDGGSGYTNFATGPGAVQVHYKAGYASIPDDLKLAVIDLVTYYHKDQSKPRQTIAGASLSNAPSSGSNNIDFPDHIKRVLDLYKNY